MNFCRIQILNEKLKTVAFFAIFIVILAGCPGGKEAFDANPAKNSNENSYIPHNESKLILEINQDAQGMWDVIGKTLFFRLYDDGIAEFEFPDDKKKKVGKTSNAQEINTLKQVKLSQEKFQQFTTLLNNADLRKKEKVYQRNCCCTDATLHYQINFKDNNILRTINLVGYCDLGELRNPSGRNIDGFPQIFSDLIILAESSKGNYINQ